MASKPKRVSLADRFGTEMTGDATLALWGKATKEQAVIQLDLRDIKPNHRQPRTEFDQEALQGLADSIRAHGVLQPIVVHPIFLTEYNGYGCRYELIAGERRWRASQIAGNTHIPAIVFEQPVTDQVLLELAIIENVQREDLRPMDEAASFQRLHEELGLSYSEIGERIGKSKFYVFNRMRLLQIDDTLRDVVQQRPDTITHVYELSRIPDSPERDQLIADVRDKGVSITETRARIAEIIAPKDAPARPKQPAVVVPTTTVTPPSNPVALSPTAHLQNAPWMQRVEQDLRIIAGEIEHSDLATLDSDALKQFAQVIASLHSRMQALIADDQQ